jgi:hypothetical protein
MDLRWPSEDGAKQRQSATMKLLRQIDEAAKAPTIGTIRLLLFFTEFAPPCDPSPNLFRECR